jgi:hypothetical protein
VNNEIHFMKNSRNKPFPSLKACLKTLRQEGRPKGGTLYRGEAGDYPHTYSLIYRLIYEQKIIPVTEINYLADTLDEIQTRLNIVLNAVPVFANPQGALRDANSRETLHPIEVAGAYLQHYYLPTPLLDVTDDLDIAARFAAGEPKPGMPDAMGCLYVMDMNGLLRSGRPVYSLKHSNAPRPRDQHAHCIMLKAGEDLQNESIFPPTVVDRYYFMSSVAERQSFFDAKFMRARGDKAALEVGRCCSSIVSRDWASCNDDQKKILRYYDEVSGLLARDEAHLE